MKDNNPLILVIEDEDQVRQSYEDMFKFFGYNVESVPNGREGMSLINKKDYDIVVTDLNMPEMNGIEVLKYIKKRKPYIEVIMITGFATMENAIQAMKVGAYDYFAKPIDIEHVRIVLSKCVQQLRSKRENEELRSLNEKLKELNELKDKFITITNHELRTPITVLKGYVELMDHFLEDSRGKDINEAMGILSETTVELVSIVEQMHDMSSFDFGKKKLVFTDIPIQDVLKLIYKEMKLQFDKRKINLKLKSEGPAVIIRGDFNRLKRSIRELVQNALKFTPEGGNVNIDYSVNNNSKQLYIKVDDNGIGIPTEKHDLIFEPFYEVQSTIHHTSSKTEFMGGGIGLGLTLAKEVIDSHQGSLHLESEEKKGSIFTVVLPYKRIKQESKSQTN